MTVSASVTANHPINPKVGVFYFEITIDHFKGNSALSIGIASKSLRKNFQVGKLLAFLLWLPSSDCFVCTFPFTYYCKFQHRLLFCMYF